MNDIFNVQIFFVVFREALEAVIVISVLLAFVKQSIGDKNPRVTKKLIRQIWFGAISGIFICLAIGCAFIGAYYSLNNDIWTRTEDLYEGIMCLIATILITMMGVAMLRINKMQAKWRVKIARALIDKKTTKIEGNWLKKLWYRISHWDWDFGDALKRYSMFILPFITTLREGLEAVVFVGGVGIGSPARSFPLPVVCGLIGGALVGGFMYYGGSTISLQIFLCISTAILYLISAGLFSRGVWFLENYVFNQKTGGDAAENGSGPGTYNINNSVWHVNCCNPLTDNGWDVFNSLLGWQNSATYGSVLSYNLYWLFLIVTLALMLYEEKKGHLPFCKNLKFRELNPMYHIKNKKKNEISEAEAHRLFLEARSKLQGKASDESERDDPEQYELNDIPTEGTSEEITNSTNVGFQEVRLDENKGNFTQA